MAAPPRTDALTDSLWDACCEASGVPLDSADRVALARFARLLVSSGLADLILDNDETERAEDLGEAAP